MARTRAFAAIPLLLALGACSDGGGGVPPLRAEPTRLADPSAEARSEARATIVRVSVRIAESFPPQYFADITSALENGCARFSRAVTRREETTVFVDVFHTRPSDPNVACTMIYGEEETAVALGSEFSAGTTYTLDVNGTRETFVAE